MVWQVEEHHGKLRVYDTVAGVWVVPTTYGKIDPHGIYNVPIGYHTAKIYQGFRLVRLDFENRDVHRHGPPLSSARRAFCEALAAELSKS